MALDHPFSLLTHDVAIDLGTANTLVALPGRGVVLDEPSVVAVRHRGNHREVVAVGAAARDMLGRTPESITAVRPLKAGVVQDYEVAEAMLRFFIARAVGRRSLLKPRLLVAVPSSTTEVERRAVQACARAAGGREVVLIQAPVAAAMGAGLPVADPVGTLICDVGAGITEVAVLSLGGVVTRQSLDVAGDAMDRAIITYLQKAHGVLVGERTAEAIKVELGCTRATDRARAFTVKGRDLTTGIPRAVTVTSDQVREALSPVVERLLEALRATLVATPPELSADIVDSGLVLAGGGALLQGLEDTIREATRLAVVMAPQPLRAVVTGLEMASDDPVLLSRMGFPARA